MVLHDYGLRFDTPIVNLFIPVPDYIDMLSELKHYMNAEMVDITNGNEYPIGLLGDNVRVNFLHYNTFEEAKEAWERRRGRMDYKNLYCVLVERDGCTYEDLLRFDKLPYKNKVALVHKPYPEIKCAFVINAPVEGGQLSQLIKYNSFWGRRYYDQFDWRKFLHIR